MLREQLMASDKGEREQLGEAAEQTPFPEELPEASLAAASDEVKLEYAQIARGFTGQLTQAKAQFEESIKQLTAEAKRVTQEFVTLKVPTPAGEDSMKVDGGVAADDNGGLEDGKEPAGRPDGALQLALWAPPHARGERRTASAASSSSNGSSPYCLKDWTGTHEELADTAAKRAKMTVKTKVLPIAAERSGL